jgi:uncharacterized protein (DUF697 family)
MTEATTQSTSVNEVNQPGRRIALPDILVPVALFFGVLGFYSLDWAYSLSNGEFGFVGGKATVGAERVLAGDIPYRDFWTMYAPGQFYLLALLFKLFGKHLLVEVVAASVVCAAAACFCYLLVMEMAGRRLLALAGAGVYAAATWNTGYVKFLGSYPTAMLLLIAALSLLVRYYRTGRIGWLLFAGLATGVAVVFKHDISAYLAIAVIAGLGVYHLMRTPGRAGLRGLLVSAGAYAAALAAVVVLPLLFLGISAGPDMLQDLVVFELTDFRYSRPEHYPSLLPTGIWDESAVTLLRNVGNYVTFALPFVLFLAGLLAIGLAVRRRNFRDAAVGTTLAAAFVLHYLAAHVQINTHIITLSVYGLCLGALFDRVTMRRWALGRPKLVSVLTVTLVAGWLVSLLYWPAYMAGWEKRASATVELSLPRVSGFRVSPQEARALADLVAFVDARVPSDQPLYVGLHRHDVIIIGDVMAYFLLARPNATRYQELHPAINDTAAVQQEMIRDLERQQVPIIILKHIFPDETLEQAKRQFRTNLPHVGATDLDVYIRQNYTQVHTIGPYDIWARNDTAYDAGAG